MEHLSEVLKGICSGSVYAVAPKYVGDSCFFKVPGGAAVKISLMPVGNVIDSFFVSIYTGMSRQEPYVKIPFDDAFGGKGIGHRIAKDSSGCYWENGAPSDDEYAEMGRLTDEFLSVFSNQKMDETPEESCEIKLI